MFVLFVGTRNLQGSFGDALRHIIIHHHDSEDALVRAIDRNASTDNVPFSKCLGSCHFQTSKRAVEELFFRFDRDPRGTCSLNATTTDR